MWFCVLFRDIKKHRELKAACLVANTQQTTMKEQPVGVGRMVSSK